MLAKSLSFLAGADAAGIVLGARVPIIPDEPCRLGDVAARLAASRPGGKAPSARRGDQGRQLTRRPPPPDLDPMNDRTFSHDGTTALPTLPEPRARRWTTGSTAGSARSCSGTCCAGASANYYEQRAKPVPRNVFQLRPTRARRAHASRRPASYLLVRIEPPPGVRIDPQKQPFVVVDPRAGHGAGHRRLQGRQRARRRDARRAPAYFVGFARADAGRTPSRTSCAPRRASSEGDRAAPAGDGKPCVVGNCPG